MKTPREIALLIADDLFTNGERLPVERLTLSMPGGRDGGSWSMAALVAKVEVILQREMARRPK